MFRINDHYLKLQAGYLFPEIARRVSAYVESNPSTAARVIRCGIGDVTEPLPPAAIEAMHRAVDDLSRRETFHGYGPPFGHEWLRRAIVDRAYGARGLGVDETEVFLSDGSKCDCGAVLDILASGGANRIGVPDPVYPVYVDTNVMVGNTGPAGDGGDQGLVGGIVPLRGTPENDFIPDVPDEPLDVIYLCFPNNPTGRAIDRERLAGWVEYALRHDALILYDAAYEAYVSEPGMVRSIYEIDGARRCAMEFRSFSKDGGFTGVRCGYTICPRELVGSTADGRRVPLHGLWSRRWSTKSNGVSYPVQRAAEALLTDEGQVQVRTLVEHYMGNAALLRTACEDAGLRVWGGRNAPYVWVQCPEGLDSWGVFDRLLTDAQVVITPGAGFGSCGEGFFRISAFNGRAQVEEVAKRLTAVEWTATVS